MLFTNLIDSLTYTQLPVSDELFKMEGRVSGGEGKWRKVKEKVLGYEKDGEHLEFWETIRIGMQG